MDHLLFFIVDVKFLVKFSSSTYVHFGNFNTANLTDKNKKLNYIKQVLELIIGLIIL